MLDEKQQQHRNLLAVTDQKSQEAYDKTVLYLSAGGIGVSLAFVRDLVGCRPIHHPCFLFGAWAFWGLSLTMTLVSMYTSHLAMRLDIRRLDKGEKIDSNAYDSMTTATNVSAGVLFVLGLLAIGLFAASALLQEGQMEKPGTTTVVEPSRTGLAEPDFKRGLNRPIPPPQEDQPAPPPPKNSE